MRKMLMVAIRANAMREALVGHLISGAERLTGHGRRDAYWKGAKPSGTSPETMRKGPDRAT